MALEPKQNQKLNKFNQYAASADATANEYSAYRQASHALGTKYKKEKDFSNKTGMINESKTRQFMDQKTRSYQKMLDKSDKTVDPYDNTPMKKKYSSASLGLTNSAYTNNLLEQMLKTQDHSAYHDSVLNFHKQQITLLSAMSDNLKAIRTSIAPEPKLSTDTDLPEYQLGHHDAAKYIASGQFDKAIIAAGKSIGSKMDHTGMLAMVNVMKDTLRDLLEEGNIKTIIRDGIKSRVKSAVLGDYEKHWDEYKNDPVQYVQRIFAQMAGGKNSALKTFGQALFKTNAIDLSVKERKVDWDTKRNFDNKVYKSITEIMPDTLREILATLRGEQTRRFDWDSNKYLDDSQIYFKNKDQFKDGLQEAKHKIEEYIGDIFSDVADNPIFRQDLRNLIEIDDYGYAKRENGKVKIIDRQFLSVLYTFIEKTGGDFGIIGNDPTVILKKMGCDPDTDPLTYQKAREMLQLTRKIFQKGGPDVRDSLNDVADPFRELHGRNFTRDNDERMDPKVLKKLDMIADSGLVDPKEVKKLIHQAMIHTQKTSLNTIDTMHVYSNIVHIHGNQVFGNGIGVGGNLIQPPPKSGIPVNFDANGNLAQTPPKEPDMELNEKNWFQYLNHQKTKSAKMMEASWKVDPAKRRSLDKKRNKVQAILQGRSSSDIGINEETFFESNSPEDTIARLQSFGFQMHDNSITNDEINANRIKTSESTNMKGNKINTWNEENRDLLDKFTAATRVYNILNEAGMTAEAKVALHGKSKSFWVAQGYLSSPYELVEKNIITKEGKIDPKAAFRFKYGFLNDAFVAAEKEKNRQKAAGMKLSYSPIVNLNQAIGKLWQDPAIQRKTGITMGSAAGLGIGAILKDKGIIKSDYAMYAMGAAGAALMSSERMKKQMDLMYGPDSERTDNPNGMSNRKLAMMKLTNRILPIVAGGTVGLKAFKGTQKIFNAMGPTWGILGLIPSTLVGISSGAVAATMVPYMRKKLFQEQHEKGSLWDKISKFAKGNKFMRNLFGGKKLRGYAGLLSNELELTMKEYEIRANKQRTEGNLSVASNLEDILKRLQEQRDKLEQIEIADYEDSKKEIDAQKIEKKILEILSNDKEAKTSLRRRYEAAKKEKEEFGYGKDVSEMKFHDYNQSDAEEAIATRKQGSILKSTEDPENSKKMYQTLQRGGISKDKTLELSQVGQLSNEKILQFENSKIKDLDTYQKFKTDYESVNSSDKNTQKQGIQNIVMRNKDSIGEEILNHFRLERERDKNLTEEDIIGMFKNKYKNVLTPEFKKESEFDKVKTMDDLHLYVRNSKFTEKLAENIDTEQSDQLSHLIHAMDREYGQDAGNLIFSSNQTQKEEMTRAFKNIQDRLKDKVENINYGYENADKIRTEELRKLFPNVNEAELENYKAAELIQQNIESGNLRLSQNDLKKINPWAILDGTETTGNAWLDKALTNPGGSFPELREQVVKWILKQKYVNALKDGEGYDSVLKQIIENYQDHFDEGNAELLEGRLGKLRGDEDGIINDLGLRDIFTNYMRRPIKDQDTEDNLRSDIYGTLQSQIHSGKLKEQDLQEILTNRLRGEEELKRLSYLYQAIYPKREHPEGEILKLLSESKQLGLFQLLGTHLKKQGAKFIGKMNGGMDAEDYLISESEDRSVLEYLRELMGKDPSQIPKYNEKGERIGTWSDGGYTIKPLGDMKDVSQDMQVFDPLANAMAGMGYSSTEKANQTKSNRILKMSDLSRYHFKDGSRLDQTGCSIAAMNNVLVTLKVPTISVDTLTSYANSHLTSDGIHYAFFEEVAKKVGLYYTTYQAGISRFDKSFLQNLHLGGSLTAVALMDNVGNDHGAHYVNLLKCNGDNITINDPQQAGMQEMSISELSMRASYIITFKVAKQTQQAKKKPSYESGTGYTYQQTFADYDAGFGTRKKKDRRAAKRTLSKEMVQQIKAHATTETAIGAPAGMIRVKSAEDYDVDVAKLAAMTNDPKTQNAILSFIASSKNKEFAAAANRYRSLMNKPAMKDDLIERQTVQESQAKVPSLLEKIGMKFGVVRKQGDGSVKEEEKDKKDNKPGILSKLKDKANPFLQLGTLLAGTYAALKIGKFGITSAKESLSKMYHGFAEINPFDKRKEAVYDENGEMIEKGSIDMGSSGLRQLRDTAQITSLGFKPLGKVVTKVASTAKVGSKLAGFNRHAGDLFTSIGKKVGNLDKGLNSTAVRLKKVVLSILTHLGGLVKKVLYDNKAVRYIFSSFGVDIDQVMNFIFQFSGKLANGVKKKLSDSFIGKFLKQYGKKVIPIAGTAITVVQAIWGFIDGFKEAPDIFQMAKGTCTAAIRVGCGLAKVFYDNFMELIGGVVANIPGVGSMAGLALMLIGILIRAVWSFKEILDLFGITAMVKNIETEEKKAQIKGKTLSNALDKKVEKSDITQDPQIPGFDVPKNEVVNQGSNKDKITSSGTTKQAEEYKTSKTRGDEKGGPKETDLKKETFNTNRRIGSSIMKSIREFYQRAKEDRQEQARSMFRGGVMGSAATAAYRKAASAVHAYFDWSQAGDLNILKKIKFTGDSKKNINAQEMAARIISVAQQIEKKHHIKTDPILALSQWAVESDWGRKTTGAFNYFGIKAGKTKSEYWDGSKANVLTHEGGKHGTKQIKTTAPFRAYSSPEQGISDYFMMIHNNFPEVAKKGSIGLEHGKYGVYATGDYLPLINQLYSQFSNRISNAGVGKLDDIKGEISTSMKDGKVGAPSINNTTNVPTNGTQMKSSHGNLPFQLGKVSDTNWGFPLANKNSIITSAFGWRGDVPGLNGTKDHNGIDLRAPIGTPMYSSVDGTVTNVGGKYGVITIKSNHGDILKYIHSSKSNVKTNTKVKKGDMIGLTGDTGAEGNPHLHFAMQDRTGKKLDPIQELGIPLSNLKTDINSPENIRYIKEHQKQQAFHGPNLAYNNKQAGLEKGGPEEPIRPNQVQPIPKTTDKSYDELLAEVKALNKTVIQMVQIMAQVLGGSVGQQGILTNILEAIKNKDALLLRDSLQSATIGQ